MLQYIDNINYCSQQTYSIDEELTELNALCADGVSDYQLYQQIRQYVFREIKIKELAVTRILADILEMRQTKTEKAVNIIMFFVANNTMSYKQISEVFGCSKQYINQLLQQTAERYFWLRNLIQIKGEEDAKNENNRAINCYHRKQRTNKPSYTLFLWEEDEEEGKEQTPAKTPKNGPLDDEADRAGAAGTGEGGPLRGAVFRPVPKKNQFFANCPSHLPRLGEQEACR